MNKSDLVDRIAENVGITKKAAEATIETILRGIVEAVAAGDKVTLVGFGTFEPRDRRPRKGHNPATGEAIDIPASRVPAFSPGKLFKQKVAE